MGGRGASSGWSRNKRGEKVHKYGTEYSTVYQSGNIKFVEYNNSSSAKSPMETITNGRVYATIAIAPDGSKQPKYITYYDKHKKRYKQIDLFGPEHKVNGVPIIPHVHMGYIHDEKGTRAPTPKEQKMIDRVIKIWNNRLNSQ